MSCVRPLFSLGGFLELMDDEDLDEETRREFLAAMREQVDRLTRLATDLLDLSRLDAGRFASTTRCSNWRRSPRPWPTSSALSRSPTITPSRLRPVTAPCRRRSRPGGPDRPASRGERDRPHASGTPVRLRVRDGDGRAILSVEDEGLGIPEGHAEQVFERFYRAEGGRTSGSGLGLRASLPLY